MIINTNVVDVLFHSTFGNSMESIPLNTLQYCNTLKQFAHEQIVCWLNFLQKKELEIVIAIASNLLYNKHIQLTDKQKQSLKPYSEIYIALSNKKLLKKLKHSIAVKNPKAIHLACCITSEIYGSRI